MKLEQVGLRQHSEKMPAMLSGGMKKRAGLARGYRPRSENPFLR